MPALTFISFLDTFELAASLRGRWHLFKDAEATGERVLRARWAKDREAEALAFMVSPEWRKWTELTNTVRRIRRLADSTPYGPVELGDVFFQMLEPGTTLPWETPSGGYAMTHARVHLPVRTNPRAMIYCGCETIHMLTGSLHVVAAGLPQTAVNLGEWQRVHLIVDLRKKAAEPEVP